MLLGREVIDLVALNVENADRLPAHHQRHGKLRAHGFDGVEIARIFLHVADADGAARGRGRAGDSLAPRNAPVLHHFGAIADAEAEMQLIGALFREEDGEDFVVDQLFDELRRFRQNLIEV